MWAVGVTVLIVMASAIALALGWRSTSVVRTIIWDLPRIGGTYTSITGALASASIVSAIFIANITAVRQSDEFASAFGLFIIAFFILIATAIQFATTPNRAGLEDDEDFVRVQRYSYVLSSLVYTPGLTISWSTVRLVALSIDLDYVAGVLTWIAFAAVIAAVVRQAQIVYRMTGAPAIACLALPAVSVSLAAIYWFGLLENVGDLRPAHDEPLMFALVCFAVGFAGFMLQTSIYGFYEHPRLMQLARVHGDRVLLALSQGMAVSVVLLWLAVART